MAESFKNQSQKCIFVVGPTAAGKSGWALQQAQKFNGSVINVDSIQFYEGLRVGSAAPTDQERSLAPHYLYSYMQAPNEMTAGRYIEDFYKMLENEKPRFPLFIVGGTGFYIQALEKGMFNIEPVPAQVRAQLEAELIEHGPEKLWQELSEKDPQHKIHMNDHYRLVRALEIIRHTGLAPSALNDKNVQNKNALPFLYCKIGFDFEKSEFIPRVEARTKMMLQNGIIDETQSFLKKGFSLWAPLHSVGYKETMQYLTEQKDIHWLEQTINQSTLQLIKKQKTWFKRDTSILWSNHDSELLRFLS